MKKSKLIIAMPILALALWSLSACSEDSEDSSDGDIDIEEPFSTPGVGNYGTSCETNKDCKGDFSQGKCCLDEDICGNMLNKCVECTYDEHCPTITKAVDGDYESCDSEECMGSYEPPEREVLWQYLCNEGMCRPPMCQDDDECSVYGSYYLTCENDYCYQCNTDSDCSWINTGRAAGVCIRHKCFDCRTDDDCTVDWPDFLEHVCQHNVCITVLYGGDGETEDGDIDEDIAESSEEDTNGK